MGLRVNTRMNVRPAHPSESSSLFQSQMRATECYTRDWRRPRPGLRLVQSGGPAVVLHDRLTPPCPQWRGLKLTFVNFLLRWAFVCLKTSSWRQAIRAHDIALADPPGLYLQMPSFAQDLGLLTRPVSYNEVVWTPD